MLKILKMIAGNMVTDTATVRLPGSVPTPALFRGAVTMNTEKCLACGMCSYVCVSNAITGSEQAKAYAWAYEPGRCTFCARCVERCPGHALSMAPDALTCYQHPGELNMKHLVEFRSCSECGAPVRFASDDFLKRAFDHVKDETRELVRLCERCRRRRLQRNLMPSVFFDNKEKNR
jgi:formate hydrogenlyase subunit 6/NADH:ubiquinone oxidoreductase subunit I